MVENKLDPHLGGSYYLRTMHKMYLVLGDWSDDGHGKYDKVLMECNVPVKRVQDAYKKACKLTGVSFNNTDVFTGQKRDYKTARDYRIACEYDNSSIPGPAKEVLIKHGLTAELFKDFECGEDFNTEDNTPFYLCRDGYIALWCWFIRLADPEIELKVAKATDAIPVINAYWNDNLNVQFGYGPYL